MINAGILNMCMKNFPSTLSIRVRGIARDIKFPATGERNGKCNARKVVDYYARHFEISENTFRNWYQGTSPPNSTFKKHIDRHAEGSASNWLSSNATPSKTPLLSLNAADLAFEENHAEKALFLIFGVQQYLDERLFSAHHYDPDTSFLRYHELKNPYSLPLTVLVYLIEHWDDIDIEHHALFSDLLLCSTYLLYYLDGLTRPLSMTLPATLHRRLMGLFLDEIIESRHPAAVLNDPLGLLITDELPALELIRNSDRTAEILCTLRTAYFEKFENLTGTQEKEMQTALSPGYYVGVKNEKSKHYLAYR